MPRLQPLSSLPDSQLRYIDFLLFDVDETFTTHGVLTAEAYASLFDLKRAGVRTIPVTGRPSGWGNVMLSTWPIEACVTENGGVISWKDDAGVARLQIIHTEQRGPGYIVALRSLGERIAKRFPEIRVSADQPYRLTDLAIDYNEQSKNVSEDTVRAVVEMMHEAGYNTAVSSIHIHAYYPRNEKADGVYPLMQTKFGLTVDEVHARAAFIGDSPNDASLFSWIPISVGVANVRDALDQIETPPAYVCERACGAGFVEFAQRLIAARL
jgi:HAD superfamily hydrolase (TIGR01484 family)